MSYIKKMLDDVLRNFPYFDFPFWSKRVEKSLAQVQRIAKNADHKNWYTPIVYIVALLWTIVTIGIAIGSFFTLFSSLLLLYFIFTKIFGWELPHETLF